MLSIKFNSSVYNNYIMIKLIFLKFGTRVFTSHVTLSKAYSSIFKMKSVGSFIRKTLKNIICGMLCRVYSIFFLIMRALHYCLVMLSHTITFGSLRQFSCVIATITLVLKGKISLRKACCIVSFLTPGV